MQSLNITIFWNYSSFIRCGNSERFCFSCNLSAFVSRVLTLTHSGIALIFGQEGHHPPKSKGTLTSMTLWTFESVVVLFLFLSGSIYFLSAALSTRCAITTQNGIIRKKIEA